MKMRILSAEDVGQALPMADAIAGMKQAFAQLSTGAGGCAAARAGRCGATAGHDVGHACLPSPN